ncbi:hypothetical protein [Pasteurella multocida]|uniref:hypothetical protein n=1 Tax=Pasteurella multocida TaxID=747 RepID=UPI001E46B214|nr:hypothetical protein [Pasteurella multocida]
MELQISGAMILTLLFQLLCFLVAFGLNDLMLILKSSKRKLTKSKRAIKQRKWLITSTVGLAVS